jgi:hypothetical protein
MAAPPSPPGAASLERTNSFGAWVTGRLEYEQISREDRGGPGERASDYGAGF